jgi:hypothetical protein
MPGVLIGGSMNLLLIGNIVSLAGSALMVGVGFLKTRKSILITQCAMFTLMGAANIILGGITGAISSLVSILRNVFSLRGPLSVHVKLFIIALQILLSANLNTLGWIGWLPIISACFYTWMIDVKDETRLKVVLIIAQSMWLIYDITIQNYVAFTFDVLTILSNMYGILSLRESRKVRHSAA